MEKHAIDDAPSRGALSELAVIFLRLGATSFGGPLAHIALMEQEFVQKRAWMTRQEFVDLVGATNLIPGPNSTEIAIHIGHRRAGWPGLVVAGACFILPAALMMLGVAWVYTQFGARPQAQWLLRGVAPVVVAIVAQALWKFAQTALMSTHARLVASIALVFVALGASELATLALAAAFGLARGFILQRKIAKTSASESEKISKEEATIEVERQAFQLLEDKTARGAMSQEAARGRRLSGLRLVPLLLLLWPLLMPSVRGLFLAFLKIGSVLYGSGYVLLAFLESEFVPRFLTQRQLLDAVAIGQITPGPLFTTATFIGFQSAGFWGACAATLGIFAPSFCFVALLSLLMERLRNSVLVRAFLDAVNAASLALMAWVTWLLARSAFNDFHDIAAIAVGTVSFVILMRTRINSVWLLLAGALWGIGNAWLALH